MTTEIEDLTEKALEVFWRIISRHFPEAKTGDLSPFATIRLRAAAEAAVAEWIDGNVPPTAKSEKAK